MTEKKVTTRKKATSRKKATPRKRVARKAQPKSVFERLESSVVGTPIRIANRTFLASLGLVSTMQTEFTKFQSDFGKTFEKLVKDGEKARARYRAGFKDFREDLREDVKDLREDVKDFREDIVEDVVEVKDRVVEKVESAVTK